MSKYKRNSDYKNYFTCKRVAYYSQFDESAFFEWLDKIDCIESYEGSLDELYLDLVNREIKGSEILELAALFYRYKIDMKQLLKYRTEENEYAFEAWQKEILEKNT